MFLGAASSLLAVHKYGGTDEAEFEFGTAILVQGRTCDVYEALQIPRFKFLEESKGDVVRRASLGFDGLLLPICLTTLLATRALKRYPLVGWTDGSGCSSVKKHVS